MYFIYLCIYISTNKELHANGEQPRLYALDEIFQIEKGTDAKLTSRFLTIITSVHRDERFAKIGIYYLA